MLRANTGHEKLGVRINIVEGADMATRIIRLHYQPASPLGAMRVLGGWLIALSGIVILSSHGLQGAATTLDARSSIVATSAAELTATNRDWSPTPTTGW